ncbi:hypothetical protein Rhopal_007075-T1 [Rhodotorula paludigena]|uniref:Uncharacterized protein n=1 Tax=Rhodotorula paludigena TaxID=86838 RepID=A0AAV5GYA1_9BASI|nr:hypothetical protein Rhopal_007075-T1 [Rhodotorula paludigena]
MGGHGMLALGAKATARERSVSAAQLAGRILVIDLFALVVGRICMDLGHAQELVQQTIFRLLESWSKVIVVLDGAIKPAKIARNTGQLQAHRNKPFDIQLGSHVYYSIYCAVYSLLAELGSERFDAYVARGEANVPAVDINPPDLSLAPLSSDELFVLAHSVDYPTHDELPTPQPQPPLPSSAFDVLVRDYDQIRGPTREFIHGIQSDGPHNFVVRVVDCGAALSAAADAVREHADLERAKKRTVRIADEKRPMYERMREDLRRIDLETSLCEEAAVFSEAVLGDERSAPKEGLIGPVTAAITYVVAKGDLNKAHELLVERQKTFGTMSDMLASILANCAWIALPSSAEFATTESLNSTGMSTLTYGYSTSPLAPAQRLLDKVLKVLGIDTTGSRPEDLWQAAEMLPLVQKGGFRILEDSEPASKRRRTGTSHFAQETSSAIASFASPFIGSGKPGDPFGLPFNMRLWTDAHCQAIGLDVGEEGDERRIFTASSSGAISDSSSKRVYAWDVGDEDEEEDVADETEGLSGALDDLRAESEAFLAAHAARALRHVAEVDATFDGRAKTVKDFASVVVAIISKHLETTPDCSAEAYEDRDVVSKARIVALDIAGRRVWSTQTVGIASGIISLFEDGGAHDAFSKHGFSRIVLADILARNDLVDTLNCSVASFVDAIARALDYPVLGRAGELARRATEVETAWLRSPALADFILKESGPDGGSALVKAVEIAENGSIAEAADSERLSAWLKDPASPAAIVSIRTTLGRLAHRPRFATDFSNATIKAGFTTADALKIAALEHGNGPSLAQAQSAKDVLRSLAPGQAVPVALVKQWRSERNMGGPRMVVRELVEDYLTRIEAVLEVTAQDRDAVFGGTFAFETAPVRGERAYWKSAEHPEVGRIPLPGEEDEPEGDFEGGMKLFAWLKTLEAGVQLSQAKIKAALIAAGFATGSWDRLEDLVVRARWSEVGGEGEPPEGEQAKELLLEGRAVLSPYKGSSKMMKRNWYPSGTSPDDVKPEVEVNAAAAKKAAKEANC